MSKLLRILTSTAVHFRRNLWLSIITIVIMGFASFAGHLLIATRVLTTAAAELLTQKVDITLYLSPQTSNETAAQLQKKIQRFPNVASVQVESADQVYATFLKRYEKENDTIKALRAINTNPFGSVIRVRGDTIGDYSKIFEELNDPTLAAEGVIARKSFDDRSDLLERFSHVERSIRWTVEGVLAFFLFLSLIVVYNTIRMAIFSQRDEIGIMKLVGATNGFIRLPFVIEGVVYTVIAVGLSFALWIPFVRWIDPGVVNLFTTSHASIADFYSANMLTLVLIQTGTLAIASMGSAGLAVGRYLKV